MPEQPNQFNKVTPDLEDPHQNEFVQDYLSELQRVEYTGSLGDSDLIESAIELVQEIYSPTPPPMTRLKDLVATEVILNYNADGAIIDVQVNGHDLNNNPTWILIHNHDPRVRVSRISPEPHK